MSKLILIALLPFLGLFSNGSDNLLTEQIQNTHVRDTGTLEKMIVGSGSVSMHLNLKQFRGIRSGTKTGQNVLLFDVQPNSFFTVLVFNNELRGPVPSSMNLMPQNSAALPGKMNASAGQLVVESMPWGDPYELTVRDGKSGFVFFNVEGLEYDYDADQHLFSIGMARLLMSKEFAAELGQPAEAGSVIGQISIAAIMRDIEVTQVVDGEVKSDVLPAEPSVGGVPGPDVIVGDITGLQQFGSSSGTQVGVAVGTTSCNAGVVDLDWFALPENDHPVIPQNLYRMSGGPSNNDRFEQIGQSNVKHAFTALMENVCNFGCNGVSGTHLGSGCSDPYTVSLNSGPSLGSRAWINPFTGAYPRGDSATPPNNHTGHTHTGPAHLARTEINDLNTALNPGATYFAEAQYVTPHEYVWCQAHAGQCNMYNNVSHRRYTVTGTGSPFSFSAAAPTVQGKPALGEWTGSTGVQIQPDPGNDGIGSLTYKITNPAPGVWHYEYAIYNQNLDRAIQSFSLPMGASVILSNVGFHAPPQQPGWTFDGTVGNTGYSSTPWTQTQTSGAMTWSSETFAQNQNANAVRWGTLYNIRFDANQPPAAVNATIGFLKTGAPITIQIQGPSTPVGSVTISGSVLTPDLRGLRGAVVTLTDSHQVKRTVTTNSFGAYSFDNVATGDTYTVAVTSKLYRFSSQTFPLNDNVANMNFVGQE